MTDHFPTPEQMQALTLFNTGEGLAIEAGAGTGKTSTLIQLAQSCPARRGQYVAFNKSIVTEAGQKLPGNVVASTAHSLAFRAVGRQYSHRLNGPRVRSDDIARRLSIDPFVVKFGEQSKVLQPSYLGGLVMRAIERFCQTADEAPTADHVPYVEGIDLPEATGRRGYQWNTELATLLVPAMRAAWADLASQDGTLPFKHSHYLKLWQLSHPTIPADFILFDEAQDASPVMMAVISRQDHAQVVWVGDSNQQIYEFTGAVNALASVAATQRAFLSQSFRFGPAVAEVANRMLERLHAELRLTGTQSIASVVDAIAEPDAVLCRTNAAAVQRVLTEQEQGRRPHLVGGGAEVVAFARAAEDLMSKGWTSHFDLACFTSWGEVTAYVEQDAQGAELKLMVDLVENFTVPVILRALERMTPEAQASIVVSTAHKSKGREWNSVQIADDFPDGSQRDVTDSDLRLLYVAATRAKRELDITRSPVLSGADDLLRPMVPGLEGLL